MGFSVRPESYVVPPVPPPSPELGSPPRQSLPPLHPTDGPFRGLVGNQFKFHMIKGYGEGTHADEHYSKSDNEEGDASESAIEDDSPSESLSDEQQEWMSQSSTIRGDDASLDATADDKLSIGHKQRFQHVDSRSDLTKMLALSKPRTLPPNSREIRLNILVQECTGLLDHILLEHQDKSTTIDAVKKRGSSATGVSQRLESNPEESNLWNPNLDRAPCEDYHERGW